MSVCLMFGELESYTNKPPKAYVDVGNLNVAEADKEMSKLTWNVFLANLFSHFLSQCQ